MHRIPAVPTGSGTANRTNRIPQPLPQPHVRNDVEVPIAILRVQIICCHNLEAKDRNGYSDPFVVVSTLGKEFRTPVCKRNLNPVYNPQEATFDFPIYMSLVQRLGSVNLKFVVWDKDFFGRDFLGKNTLSVNEWFKGTAFAFHDSENQPIVVGLFSSRTTTMLDGSMTIKIGLIATHHSTTQPDFRNILNTLANPVLAPQVDHVGIVTLVIWGANNLPDWPTVTRIGWDMDPYVKVTAGDEVKCTQVIRHDRNPIWDKQLVFHVRQSELADPIVLSVFDWDRVSFDDHVGDARINISQLIRRDPAHEFYPANFPTMCEFVNVPLTTNPKRSYKCIPTLTFRAGYQTYDELRKLGQCG